MTEKQLIQFAVSHYRRLNYMILKQEEQMKQPDMTKRVLLHDPPPLKYPEDATESQRAEISYYSGKKFDTWSGEITYTNRMKFC